ncbi:MAG TPA: MtnX-like HAD-IB family phosphatase [Nevskia sp.]|nr:MtnX-like HAD-IB family phosphatase [Nevskia sp.]
MMSFARSAPASDWLVVCDFDGTIAEVDVTDGVLNRFALPQWEEIEADWKAGRFGSRECMSRQVDLVRAPREALDAYLDTVRIDPHFPAFVADCRRMGLEVVVISDGIDYSIRRILARYGLDDLPLASNRLEMLGGDRYRLSFPDANPKCSAGSGTCKCKVSNRRASGRSRLLIGDGSSDFCLAAEADLVYAKDKLLARCIERGLPHRACPDFATARQLLPRLSPSRVRSADMESHTPVISLETLVNG